MVTNRFLTSHIARIFYRRMPSDLLGIFQWRLGIEAFALLLLFLLCGCGNSTPKDGDLKAGIELGQLRHEDEVSHIDVDVQNPLDGLTFNMDLSNPKQRLTILASSDQFFYEEHASTKTNLFQIEFDKIGSLWHYRNADTISLDNLIKQPFKGAASTIADLQIPGLKATNVRFIRKTVEPGDRLDVYVNDSKAPGKFNYIEKIPVGSGNFSLTYTGGAPTPTTVVIKTARTTIDDVFAQLQTQAAWLDNVKWIAWVPGPKFVSVYPQDSQKLERLDYRDGMMLSDALKQIREPVLSMDEDRYQTMILLPAGSNTPGILVAGSVYHKCWGGTKQPPFDLPLRPNDVIKVLKGSFKPRDN